ncbi:MAG TPA: hypothetical protein VF119_00430, partial [Candidatus Limnocylindrales bacterium]
RTEIDGVRTLWMDEPGPPMATLVFRVGRADEPTPLGGISHIVEHLALVGLGVQDYDHNGMVDAQWSMFMTAGQPDELPAFFDQVVAGLVDPPVDRLLIERRILREEREQRGPSIGGAARWFRFGYAGQGRGLGPADDELGLGWVGPDRVREWARGPDCASTGCPMATPHRTPTPPPRPVSRSRRTCPGTGRARRPRSPLGVPPRSTWR